MWNNKHFKLNGEIVEDLKSSKHLLITCLFRLFVSQNSAFTDLKTKSDWWVLKSLLIQNKGIKLLKYVYIQNNKCAKWLLEHLNLSKQVKVFRANVKIKCKTSNIYSKKRNIWQMNIQHKM